MAASMAFFATIFLLSYISLLRLSFQTNLQNQSSFFTLVQQTMSGSSFSQWNISNNSSNTPQSTYCNYVGITCGDDGYVMEVDLSSWFLAGHLPDICSYLPKLRVLRLAYNHIHGGFPTSVLNCSFLQELDLSHSKVVGTLPNLSPLKSLRVLDLSYNLFYGEFPLSITNLTSLELLNFNENAGFRSWKLPEEITCLANLKHMLLMTCSVTGFIPALIGNMSSLVDLELSGNYLAGQIPVEIGRLKNLESLQLYYNQLTGEIPDEIGNLTNLFDIDMSVNRLEGNIPESLCSLPLDYLQLYNNSLTGKIPPALGNSTSLRMLSIYLNFLTGEIPRDIGKYSELVGIDLSENKLSGELPPHVCGGGKLIYFLLLDNQLSGILPEDYAKCNSLIRFRVSHNSLNGPIPDGILGLPNAAIIDFGSNHFEGPLPNSICNAKNLSELYIQGNRISGTLPTEISKATNLVKIDLSNNLLSGPIPSEIGNLRKLNVLMLQSNKLSSSIPGSLSLLKSLNLLNLSNNLLSGKIPENLFELLPNSLDFSNNQLSGPVPIPLITQGLLESYSGNPGLCRPNYFNSSSVNLPLCEQTSKRKRLDIIWGVGISAFIIILAFLLFLKRRINRERVVMEQDPLSRTSSFSYDIKSFHKHSFNQREITDALIEKNVIGYGGSGTVYKIDLSNGQSVAVKKLWTSNTKDLLADQLFLDGELEAEVETLGNIRHKNIIKLYCYFSNSDSNLLVYEYMLNGNLWDSLHRHKGFLNWPTRHRIALGVAQGLAYLHHDLLLPIIHRDIKSTNILLDADFEPKVADFGVAKVLQARVNETSTTVIAGTYGYLAPEYAYSSKATAKCDVYSFGVVLMELITGKKPVESEFGENKNIVFWISQKVATKDRALDVLDKRLLGHFKDDMIRVLRIALRCTCGTPALRPTMKEIVQLLIEANPCQFDACKTSGRMEGSHSHQ